MFTCNASSLPNIDYINFGKTRTTFDDSIFTSEVNLLWLQKPLEMASMISKLIELGIHPITCYQICSIILFNNSPMILQNTDIFRHLHQVCQLNVFHFQYMISFYSIMLTLSCTDNFQPSADFQSCVCLKFLSADKSKCVKSCEEIGETSFDGRCVKAIGLKSAANNNDCVTQYNKGSIWDGASGCLCDNANNFAGDPNNLCTNCSYNGREAHGNLCVECIDGKILQDLKCKDCPVNMVMSQDRLSCVTKSFKNNAECKAWFNPGSIWDGNTLCKCDRTNGYIGAPNSLCISCWDKDMLVGADQISCIKCTEIYVGSRYYYAIHGCECDFALGFVGAQNSDCINCWVQKQQAHNNQCEPCTGNKIFKDKVCQECPSNLVPGSDQISCVTCSTKYGVGSIYFPVGLCKCNNRQGFAGEQNSMCTDCWEINQFVSGATCVPNNVMTSTEECIKQYNQGSMWDEVSGCKCDNENGYVGDVNSFCTDCWRLGQVVQGSSCVSCSGNKLFKNNQCYDCNSMMVISADNTSCVTCFTKYGPGSISSPNDGTCECDNSQGFVGPSNSICTDCWRLRQIAAQFECRPCDSVSYKIFQNGRCEECPNGLVPNKDGSSCITCRQKFGIGSIYNINQIGTCSCDNANGFVAFGENSQCIDCLRSDSQDKQLCSNACGTKETWDSAQKKCVCDVASGYGGVSGACSCDIDKGYAGIDICTKCWDQAKIATISGCQDCPANEVFAPNSLSQCSCDSSKGYSGLPGSCSCSQPGFALTLGVCWNCAQNNQVTSPSGCQACPEFEKINPSTKACVCDSSLGYTGVSGGCYCNFGVGLIQAIDNNGVKSCVCKSSNGHVLDAASPSVSCKCDASTGHAGQPGACFCDSSTGHFGYPGFCMCNFNLQFVGSAGSCKNCAALNAHASQFNGAYFCRCNGDSGYGSPDAGGTCRLCASANSVVQVDSQGQFQCVACAATEKIVDNMCVCATARQLRYSMDQ
ncbi:Hypothetical_protein [Hexamita inflata]|uniref:Hypothetical_protein n=1 Tax=Hexamita inflata TaxID=28002 RepID=A0AA86QKQ6_9EUKA|nr:Hypothetical protein HINF_LOCUS45942 [Hexamita inflata]